MNNDEEINRLRELAGTMLSMLRNLHENYGWDELCDTLESVEDDAATLKVIA